MKPRLYDYAPSVLVIVIMLLVLVGAIIDKAGLIYAGVALLIPLQAMIWRGIGQL